MPAVAPEPETKEYVRPRVRCVLVPLTEGGPSRVHDIEIDGVAIRFNKATLEMDAGDVVALTIRFLPSEVTVETETFGGRS